MRNSAIAVVCLSLLAVAPRARAQEPPPPPAVPPAPPPPLAWHPAPYTGPTPLEIDALEATGHHKKRIGVILMASGGAILAAGTGLVIAGSWNRDDHCFDHTYGYDGGRSYGGCSSRALTLAGATTSVIGVGALVPGIIEHISGANDVDLARRLRRCSGLCWHPTIAPGGGGVELELQR